MHYTILPIDLQSFPPEGDLNRLEQIDDIADRLFGHHGLRNWSFEANPRLRTQFGYCDWLANVIAINRHFVVHGEAEEIVETLRRQPTLSWEASS